MDVVIESDAAVLPDTQREKSDTQPNLDIAVEVDIEPTAPPVATELNDDEIEQSPASLCGNVATSVSPPPVDLTTEEADMPSSVPPAYTTDRSTKATSTKRRRAPRVAMLLSAALLTAGLGAAGFIYLRPSQVFESFRDTIGARPAGLARSTEKSDNHCKAELRLQELPTPHEVLIGLGEAPLTSRPVPVGVRLELMAIAPTYQPKRLIIPADANWRDGLDGSRSLTLKVALEPGETNAWPSAPDGEVGGVGPNGHLELTAEQGGTEIWLVAAVGNDSSASVDVPCDRTAHILVVNPTNPHERRRLSVAARLLQAAAGNGGADISVKP
jgi:hypothetical protein